VAALCSQVRLTSPREVHGEAAHVLESSPTSPSPLRDAHQSRPPFWRVRDTSIHVRHQNIISGAAERLASRQLSHGPTRPDSEGGPGLRQPSQQEADGLPSAGGRASESISPRDMTSARGAGPRSNAVAVHMEPARPTTRFLPPSQSASTPRCRSPIRVLVPGPARPRSLGPICGRSAARPSGRLPGDAPPPPAAGAACQRCTPPVDSGPRAVQREREREEHAPSRPWAQGGPGPARAATRA
jgi:hypothetical protein